MVILTTFSTGPSSIFSLGTSTTSFETIFRLQSRQTVRQLEQRDEADDNPDWLDREEEVELPTLPKADPRDMAAWRLTLHEGGGLQLWGPSMKEAGPS